MKKLLLTFFTAALVCSSTASAEQPPAVPPDPGAPAVETEDSVPNPPTPSQGVQLDAGSDEEEPGDAGTEDAADAADEAEDETVKPAANPAKDDPKGTAMNIITSLKAGKWLAALGGILMFLVWFMRTVLSQKLPWFATKPGGIALAFGTAFSLALATALVAGVPIGFGLITELIGGSAILAWGSGGIWGHVKDAKEFKAVLHKG